MNDENKPSTWVIQSIADQAINVEFGDSIDEGINQRVTAFMAVLKQQQIPGVTGYLPTYRSLRVSYDSLLIRQSHLIHLIDALLSNAQWTTTPSRCWIVPVCYGGEQGIDLEVSATALGLTCDELVHIHSAPTYRIYMIGFVPGFAYLGGLDERLHLARRTSPRQEVPAGSISIGGMQSAIGSVAAPSGWHLLGKTPAKSFDLRREQPFLFSAGERVRFLPIGVEEYQTLNADPDYMPQWSHDV